MPTGGFLSTGEQPAGGGGAVGNTRYAQVSPTSDPSFAALLAQILQQTPQRENMTSLQDMITGGMNSPLLQSILGPALQRLQAPQAQQRTNLTEATRAAGGLRSSSYGQNYNKLQEQQGQQQNDLMGQVIQQMLGSLISGQMQEQQNSFLPARSLTELLRTIAPSTVTAGGGVSGSRGAWDAMSPSQGLQTPMMGDTMGPAGGAPPGGSGWGGNTGGRSGGGGSSQPAPNNPGVVGGNQPQPPQYVDPIAGGGGGNSIAYNPYTGSYETVQPTQTNPYEHTYTEIPQVTEGWW